MAGSLSSQSCIAKPAVGGGVCHVTYGKLIGDSEQKKSSLSFIMKILLSSQNLCKGLRDPLSSYFMTSANKCNQDLFKITFLVCKHYCVVWMILYILF
jgi:hypothetical protein